MDLNHENCLLTSEFLMYPKNLCVIAKLTHTAIIVTPKNGKPESQTAVVIHLKDVTGCHVTEGNHTTSAKWHLCVFAYPLKKKLLKGQIRHNLSRSLGACGSKSEEENKLTAITWKRAIKHLVNGRHINPFEVQDLQDAECRNLVVYINPFSGQGKALQIYKSHVRKMFAEAEIKHTVVETEYAGHARHLVRDLNLASCDGIVIVSGDGLVHEVVNGLMDRSDWKTAIQTPIGIVPGGSGNALAAAIVYASTGCHPAPTLVVSSIFEICRAKTTPLDILSVETPDKDAENQVRRRYSILGFVIGLISDIDIESERIRWMGGELRSTIYGVMRILSKRRYTVDISLAPIDEASNATNQRVESQSSQDKKLQNELLTNFSSPVSGWWKSSGGNCVQISALNLSHIANGLMMHKNSKLSDGKIYLTQLKSSMTRLKLMKLWDFMESGIGINTDTTEPVDTTVTQCKAFRIVPSTNHSQIMTLDGERIEYGAIQCQVHEGLGRVFSSGLQHASSDLVTDSMFEIVKGRSRNLSLVYIQSRNNFYFSFLNVGWGFVADVDIESEKFRGLGNARFTVGCAVRIASYRKYHGMVSYLPLENSNPSEMSSEAATPNPIGTSFKTELSQNLTNSAETNRNNSSSAGREYQNNSCFSPKNTKVFHISSSLHESLPGKWKSIEDEFVWVMPVYLSHVGQDMFMMPNAKLDEDVIYLYCLKSGVGRAQLLNILLNIADGTHLNISSENTMVLPCRAFRLEPFTNKTGLLTVDGEAISHEPIQATVTPIKARIMCSFC